MFDKIKSVILEITGNGAIAMETDFVKDLGLNSFDVVNIIGAFEDEYGIRIPTRDVWKLRRVCDLMGYLKEKGLQ